MTSCGSVLPHLASLENSRFLVAFGEGIALASVGLPLLALLLRVLPTLGSVNAVILLPIHGETKVMRPSRSARRSFRFASSLGGHRTSMYSLNALLFAFRAL